MPTAAKIKKASAPISFSNLRARSKMEEMALDHPGHFHKYVFRQEPANFHWEMLDDYMAARDNPWELSPILILAPRNHAKTTYFGETVPLWEIGHDPTILIQVISSVDTVAKKRVKRIASVIRDSDRYRNLFGNLYPGTDDRYTWSPSGEAIEVKSDRAQAWDTEGGIERDPTVSAYGILTAVEGGRANLQVYDDIINEKNANSMAERKRIRNRYHMSFQPMLQPKGVSIILGTRYHHEDLYSELIPMYDREGLYTDLYPRDEVMSLGFMEEEEED